MTSTLHLHIYDPKYTFSACFAEAWCDLIAVLSFSGTTKEQNDIALDYLKQLNDPHQDAESLVYKIAFWLKNL
jgi:hypothetical protein